MLSMALSFHHDTRRLINKSWWPRAWRCFSVPIKFLELQIYNSSEFLLCSAFRGDLITRQGDVMIQIGLFFLKNVVKVLARRAVSFNLFHGRREELEHFKRILSFQRVFFFFWPHHMAFRILVPWPGIEPQPSAVKAPSPNHWTAREVPTIDCLFRNSRTYFVLPKLNIKTFIYLKEPSYTEKISEIYISHFSEHYYWRPISKWFWLLFHLIRWLLICFLEVLRIKMLELEYGGSGCKSCLIYLVTFVLL